MVAHMPVLDSVTFKFRGCRGLLGHTASASCIAPDMQLECCFDHPGFHVTTTRSVATGSRADRKQSCGFFWRPADHLWIVKEKLPRDGQSRVEPPPPLRATIDLS